MCVSPAKCSLCLYLSVVSPVNPTHVYPKIGSSFEMAFKGDVGGLASLSSEQMNQTDANTGNSHLIWVHLCCPHQTSVCVAVCVCMCVSLALSLAMCMYLSFCVCVPQNHSVPHVLAFSVPSPPIPACARSICIARAYTSSLSLSLSLSQAAEGGSSEVVDMLLALGGWI